MPSPQSLRMTARDMERDARELEEVISAIDFLNANPDCVPSVDIQFPGFKSDGEKAAKQLENWITEEWTERREQLLERFRSRRQELEDRWE